MRAGRSAVQVKLSAVFHYVFAVGLLIAVLAGPLLASALEKLPPNPLEQTAALLISVPLVVLLHEAAHAVAARAVGGSRVGFGWVKLGPLIAGVYTSVERPVPATRWLIIALAPLTLSAAFLLLAPAEGLVGAVALLSSWMNLIGASGDLVFAALVAGSGSKASVHDLGDRLVIADSGLRASVILLLDAAYVFVVCLLVIGSLSLLAAAITKGEVSLGGMPLAEVTVTGQAVPTGSRGGQVTYTLSVKHGAVVLALVAVTLLEALFGMKRCRRALERLEGSAQ